jgi:hypothetical protein
VVDLRFAMTPGQITTRLAFALYLAVAVFGLVVARGAAPWTEVEAVQVTVCLAVIARTWLRRT